MLVGYGGTVYSLVKTFCVRCAENDSAVLMIAEGVPCVCCLNSLAEKMV